MKKKEPRKPKYVTTLENKVVRLAKKVKELEEKSVYADQIKSWMHFGYQFDKPKEPETFEDCVNLTEGAYFPMLGKGIDRVHPTDKIQALKDGLAPSEKRAKQLAAIAKMMTVADVLNGDWKFLDGGDAAYILCEQTIVFAEEWYNVRPKMEIPFKNKQTAEKAIKILGEETIKTAFGL